MSDERLTIPPIVPGTSDRLLHPPAGVWVGLAAGLAGANTKAPSTEPALIGAA